MKKKDMEKVTKGENLATARPDLTAQWSDLNYPKTPQDYTTGSGAKVWWKSECGLSWQATIASRVKGCGDPYLSGRLPIPGKTDLATVRPDLAAQWSDLNYPKTPQDYTAGSNAKVWWKSECGLSWQATIASRVKGCGDPYLSGRLPIPGKTDLATVRPDLVALWNDEVNLKTAREYTAQSHAVVWWKSSTGMTFRARICDMARKTRDPYLSRHLTEN